MIAPDDRPYSYLKSTIDQRGALLLGLRRRPGVLFSAPGGQAWHDVRVTAEQAGPMGGRSDAMARAVIECAADAIVAFGTDRT